MLGICGRNSVHLLRSLALGLEQEDGRLLSIKFIAVAAAAAVALFQINRSNQVAIDSGQLMTQTAVATAVALAEVPGCERVKGRHISRLHQFSWRVSIAQQFINCLARELEILAILE